MHAQTAKGNPALALFRIQRSVEEILQMNEKNKSKQVNPWYLNVTDLWLPDLILFRPLPQTSNKRSPHIWLGTH